MWSGRIRCQGRNVSNLINLSSDWKIIEIGVVARKLTSIVSKQNYLFALDLMFGYLKMETLKLKRAILMIFSKE